jgi:hypothetical protein
MPGVAAAQLSLRHRSMRRRAIRASPIGRHVPVRRRSPSDYVQLAERSGRRPHRGRTRSAPGGGRCGSVSRKRGMPIVGPDRRRTRQLEGSKDPLQEFHGRSSAFPPPASKPSSQCGAAARVAALRALRLPGGSEDRRTGGRQGRRHRARTARRRTQPSALAFPDGDRRVPRRRRGQLHRALRRQTRRAARTVAGSQTVFDGDQGPNTGGMGAYSDSPDLSTARARQILDTIIEPVVRATGFTGFLYAGLMMTPTGRACSNSTSGWAIPETQPLMMRLESDWGEALMAPREDRSAADALNGRRTRDLRGAGLGRISRARSQTGRQKIRRDSIPSVRRAVVFHAGTKRGWRGHRNGRRPRAGRHGARRGSAGQHRPECYTRPSARFTSTGMHYRVVRDIVSAREGARTGASLQSYNKAIGHVAQLDRAVAS